MKKVLLIALVALLSLTCGKYVRLYVYGTMARTMSSGMTSLDVLSDPIMDTASASVNGSALLAPYYYSGSNGTPIAVFEDTAMPVTGVDEKLEVKTNLANAGATVRVPGDFTMTLDAVDSVRVNNPLTISWGTATDAQWFLVRVAFDTGYTHVKDTAFIMGSNAATATIPGSWLSTDGVLSIEVVAGYGPKEEKGAAGNVSNALGFWIGTNVRNGGIMVGSPFYNLAAAPKPRTVRESRLKYLEAFAPSNEIAAELLSRLK